jgi:hypothetical protein
MSRAIIAAAESNWAIVTLIENPMDCLSLG